MRPECGLLVPFLSESQYVPALWGFLRWPTPTPQFRPGSAGAPWLLGAARDEGFTTGHARLLCPFLRVILFVLAPGEDTLSLPRPGIPSDPMPPIPPSPALGTGDLPQCDDRALHLPAA